MNNNLKTAFILSIVAMASMEAMIVIALRFYSSFADIFSSRLIGATMLIAIVAAPMVLGIIAFSYLKQTKEIQRTERPYYIVSRVLSIISIVTSAVVVGIMFIVFLIVGSFVPDYWF